MKFSEYDEEPFLLNLFKDTPSGFFVDIGANNGWKGSNTRALALKSWKGLLVEADPKTFIELKKLYGQEPGFFVHHAAVWNFDGEIDFYSHCDWCSGLSSVHQHEAPTMTKIKVPCIKLDTLLWRYLVAEIDLLTIDAEGCDLGILREFSFCVLPKTIGVEHGLSKREFDLLLEPLSYKKVFESPGNSIYNKANS